MVNTNKILTVSYGTFSCTLEGFDDSFDMMKDIAEYFRDLAADDRFFGAEPPTPDADMLARIAEHKASRQVEARQESGSIVLRPTLEAPAAEADTSVEPAVESEPPAEVSEPVAEAPAFEAVEDIAADEPEAAEPEVVEEAIIEPIAKTPVAEPTPEPKFDEESVADKLSRIRAVVNSKVADEAQPSVDYSEDQHAEDLVQDAADEPAEEAPIDAILRETADVTEDNYEPIQEPEDEAPATELTAQESPAVEDPQLAEDIAEATQEAVPQEVPKAARPARVIRMKREAFDAAVADGQIEADSPKAKPEKSLSAADEEDLLRELAEVEAELNLTRLSDAPAEAEEDEVESIFAEPEDAPAEPTPVEPAAAANGDTDVSRLMDKAAQEMDRPEGAHRRSAIAHLRAAVEATRAETEAGGGLGRGDDSLDAYRDDLNNVVRPRRPRAAGAQPEPGRRPTKKPAPLKLVAEQRVDTEEAAQPRVVRPRRVSLEDDAPQAPNAPEVSAEQAATFAEFAAQAGVKDLSDVMEAAAAYMSYVEGRQKFSRPQLMNKARQIEEYQFTREDGLRSFGQLLRDGKIEKLKGGRFTVSDELIGFKPDARAVG
ncbi:MAG: hypothetical protein ACRBBS_04855 [Thalassovita sp.]